MDKGLTIQYGHYSFSVNSDTNSNLEKFSRKFIERKNFLDKNHVVVVKSFIMLRICRSYAEILLLNPSEIKKN